MKTIIRHGDVVLIAVNQEVDRSGDGQPLTIAFGEATGHHHTLFPTTKNSGAKFVEFDARKYLHIFGVVELRHQEHDCLQIPEGVYEITTERERDPFLNSIKKVVD